MFGLPYDVEADSGRRCLRPRGRPGGLGAPGGCERDRDDGGAEALAAPAVVELHHAVAEAAFVQQFELQAHVVGQGPLAPSDHDGHDEQLVLVDQPGPDRLAGELGPPTLRSRSADAFSCRTASGSKSRSIRVLALDADSSVVE